MRSRSDSPLPTYRLAIDTTNRRLASTNRFLALSAWRTARSRNTFSSIDRSPPAASFSSARIPASICIDSSTSCCEVSSG